MERERTRLARVRRRSITYKRERRWERERDSLPVFLSLVRRHAPRLLQVQHSVSDAQHQVVKNLPSLTACRVLLFFFISLLGIVKKNRKQNTSESGWCVWILLFLGEEEMFFSEIKKIGEFVCCLYSFGLYNRDDGRSWFYYTLGRGVSSLIWASQTCWINATDLHPSQRRRKVLKIYTSSSSDADDLIIMHFHECCMQL